MPTVNDHIWSFSLQPLILYLWLPNQATLADQMPEANLQADGLAEVPTQSAKDLWEPKEEDSSPYHSPSWSPAQRPLSGCPNMKYCLEI